MTCMCRLARVVLLHCLISLVVCHEIFREEKLETFKANILQMTYVNDPLATEAAAELYNDPDVQTSFQDAQLFREVLNWHSQNSDQRNPSAALLAIQLMLGCTGLDLSSLDNHLISHAFCVLSASEFSTLLDRIKPSDHLFDVTVSTHFKSRDGITACNSDLGKILLVKYYGQVSSSSWLSVLEMTLAEYYSYFFVICTQRNRLMNDLLGLLLSDSFDLDHKINLARKMGFKRAVHLLAPVLKTLIALQAGNTFYKTYGMPVEVNREIVRRLFQLEFPERRSFS